ncbi:MAG: hypothetical protein GYA33_04805, partial [Thermogutta sp.]|nr:hypothetical protein [Thermogutta sp.]
AADRSHALCYVHDLAPTLMEAMADSAAASAPMMAESTGTSGKSSTGGEGDAPPLPVHDADGRSLMPVIRGEMEGVRDRLFCYCDDPAAMGIRTSSWFALVDMSLELQPFDEPPIQAGSGSGEPPERRLALPASESPNSESPNAAVWGGDSGNDPHPDPLWDVATVRRIVELYVKPDDRWEMNDVADRCPEAAVAAIRQALAFRGLMKGELSALPPLDSSLTERRS